jgi:DNA-binding NarL/FixJ family response regulator
MAKDRIISLTLILIIVLKLADLYTDFNSSAETSHLFQEISLIILSLGLFIYLMFDLRRRTKAKQGLIRKLKLSNENIEELNQHLKDTKSAFLDVIEAQFELWGLTSTEKKVALFLVKGYTTSEIAELRSKSVKTISHQSSAIYKKAGVNGRNELAALFFETLM